MDEKEIEGKMRALPEELKKEVVDYIDFLLTRSRDTKATKRKPKFDWEGGLSEMGDKFSSVQLQHRDRPMQST